jgi:hypothetical protein
MPRSATLESANSAIVWDDKRKQAQKHFGVGGGAVGEACVCLLLQDLLHGTREEPGTLIQGAPVFPGSSRLGIEPKTPGWLVQAQPPAHRGI